MVASMKANSRTTKWTVSATTVMMRNLMTDSSGKIRSMAMESIAGKAKNIEVGGKWENKMATEFSL